MFRAWQLLGYVIGLSGLTPKSPANLHASIVTVLDYIQKKDA